MSEIIFLMFCMLNFTISNVLHLRLVISAIIALSICHNFLFNLNAVSDEQNMYQFLFLRLLVLRICYNFYFISHDEIIWIQC